MANENAKEGNETAQELDVRPEVRAFALAMEERLKANDWKGGWKDIDGVTLLRRLREETLELSNAIFQQLPEKAILREAADVGNFSMMLADRFGDLMGRPMEEE